MAGLEQLIGLDQSWFIPWAWRKGLLCLRSRDLCLTQVPGPSGRKEAGRWLTIHRGDALQSRSSPAEGGCWPDGTGASEGAGQCREKCKLYSATATRTNRGCWTEALGKPSESTRGWAWGAKPSFSSLAFQPPSSAPYG